MAEVSSASLLAALTAEAASSFSSNVMLPSHRAK
jgi:hypothetical protein